MPVYTFWLKESCFEMYAGGVGVAGAVRRKHWFMAISPL